MSIFTGKVLVPGVLYGGLNYLHWLPPGVSLSVVSTTPVGKILIVDDLYTADLVANWITSNPQIKLWICVKDVKTNKHTLYR